MTALFEHRRTPEHRVIVPRPDACWVGVDPSTRAIAAAGVLASGERRTACRPLPAGLRGAERLAYAHRTARDLGMTLAATWGVPGVIVVEEPLRAAQDMTSQQIAGAIQAGLYEGAGGPVMAEIASASWKRIGTGYGGHRKPSPKDRRAGAVYGVAAWAAGDPWRYAGESWDVADACGIAEAAWQLYDLVPSG